MLSSMRTWPKTRWTQRRRLWFICFGNFPLKAPTGLLLSSWLCMPFGWLYNNKCNGTMCRCAIRMLWIASRAQNSTRMPSIIKRGLLFCFPIPLLKPPIVTNHDNIVLAALVTRYIILWYQNLAGSIASELADSCNNSNTGGTKKDLCYVRRRCRGIARSVLGPTSDPAPGQLGWRPAPVTTHTRGMSQRGRGMSQRGQGMSQHGRDRVTRHGQGMSQHEQCVCREYGYSVSQDILEHGQHHYNRRTEIRFTKLI